MVVYIDSLQVLLLALHANIGIQNCFDSVSIVKSFCFVLKSELLLKMTSFNWSLVAVSTPSSPALSGSLSQTSKELMLFWNHIQPVSAPTAQLLLPVHHLTVTHKLNTFVQQMQNRYIHKLHSSLSIVAQEHRRVVQF